MLETPLMEKLPTETESPISVCFVCTGNTCRSPMAAAVLNHLGKGAYRAASAGLSAVMGDAISENAVKALASRGIKSTPENNYKNHRAMQTSLEYLERFDKIVAISESHLFNLICSYPTLTEKITVMPKNIPDPFMCGEEVYKRCLDDITDGIKELFAI